jgi:hypothetical protein
VQLKVFEPHGEVVSGQSASFYMTTSLEHLGARDRAVMVLSYPFWSALYAQIT